MAESSRLPNLIHKKDVSAIVTARRTSRSVISNTKKVIDLRNSIAHRETLNDTNSVATKDISLEEDGATTLLE